MFLTASYSLHDHRIVDALRHKVRTTFYSRGHPVIVCFRLLNEFKWALRTWEEHDDLTSLLNHQRIKNYLYKLIQGQLKLLSDVGRMICDIAWF